VTAPLAVIVLAAGQGTRMKSALPKVLHQVGGRSMIGHVLAAAEALDPARIVVVVGPGMESVAAAVAPHPTAIQAEPLGTAHAVLAAEAAVADLVAQGARVLILYGDGALIQPATLRALTAAVDRAPFAWLGARPADPTGYGRLIVEDGELARIVEEKDASAEERKVGLIWGGLLAGEGRALFDLARRIDANNAKHEFYLTSLVALGRAAGQRSVVVESDFDEVRPANTRAELAETEAAFQHRRRREAMEAGATLVAPETVFLSWDTVLAPDVVVEPHVIFGPGVSVAPGATIRGFSHLAGVTVEAGAIVGPFARLRPGSRVGEGAHVGNFVELKAATLGAGAKANHLSYIGDATVGARANVGAGTITANYDGVMKHRTEIGAGASIGSNAVLVAPVSVGEGAIVGAGTTVTTDVAADAIAVARPQLSVSQRSAERHRARLKRIKAEKEGPKGPKES